MALYTITQEKLCRDCGQQMPDRVWTVTGEVVPSADGSEWVVTVLAVLDEGRRAKPTDMTAKELERAEDALVAKAHYAETAHGSEAPHGS